MTGDEVRNRKPGCLTGLVPHALILVLMVWEVQHGEGHERGFAGLAGLYEVRVVPAALIIAVALRWTHLRHLSHDLIAATMAGAAVVVVAMLIVGSGVLFG